MANEEHLAILMQGGDIWNQWRKENPEIEVDLNEAVLGFANLAVVDLRRVNLHSAILYEANLTGANLTGANLTGASLTEAILTGANLTEAILWTTDLRAADIREANLSRANILETDLFEAILVKANLRGANLHGANLRRANLIRADLRAANIFDTDLADAEFDGTTIGGTSFRDIDLSSVKRLETVRHEYRSHIDINTIYKSKGNIPEAFLRGIGVPDLFIEYMGSLVGKAIEYYSCFISYSSKDEALAERLHADLQNKGVRCWFALHDLPIGERIRIGIDEAIRFHDKLLLILSQDSVGSDWVEHEVETAMEKERSQGQLVLFPIRIDDTAMKVPSGWAAHVRRTRNIGDFRKWKDHDAYQEVFQRLLRDLKADKKAPTPVAVFAEPHRPHQLLELDEERMKLKNILVEHFNDSELRDLYDDLNVDYENVPGETKGDKARELVAYFERHRPGGAATLAEYVRDKRPYAFTNKP